MTPGNKRPQMTRIQTNINEVLLVTIIIIIII